MISATWRAPPAEAMINSGGQNWTHVSNRYQELNSVTDEHVMRDLRTADRRKHYWVDEDPSLERMLQWIRLQR